MKRIIYILIIASFACASSGAYGQNDDDPVIKIFNKYENREGAEFITISPALFGLIKNGNPSDKKTQELISKITGLSILTLSDGVDGKGRAGREALATELQAVVKKDFEEIMKVKSSGESSELYVRNCKNCKAALLFISSSINSVTVLHLTGTIDKTMIDAVMNGEIGISNK